MANQEALNRIYNALKSGKVYGEWLKNARFPCFWYVLGYDGKLFYYRHYGSSAIKANKKDLQWLLNTIFKMTPDEFESKYIFEAD